MTKYGVCAPASCQEGTQSAFDPHQLQVLDCLSGLEKWPALVCRVGS